MSCPYCNYNSSKVIDSRESGDGIRRRRECLRCSLRFTTYEQVQSRVLLVVKRDGRSEDFNRDKLWTSINRACAKRPIPTGSIDKAVQEIESILTESGKPEIQSIKLGNLVMATLKRMDRVAYIRFASVYRDFQDIEAFKQEIESLLSPIDASKESNGQLSFLDDEPDTKDSRRYRRRQHKPRPKNSSR